MNILDLLKKNIVIDLVFPNRDLMERDRNLYDNWITSYNLKQKIKFHHDIDNLTKNSFVLIDEADSFVYSGNVIRKTNHKGIIGFTATIKSKREGAEQAWLAKNNIQIFDSGIHPDEIPINSSCNEAMINDIDTRMTPIIVYCDAELSK